MQRHEAKCTASNLYGAVNRHPEYFQLACCESGWGPLSARQPGPAPLGISQDVSTQRGGGWGTENEQDCFWQVLHVPWPHLVAVAASVQIWGVNTGCDCFRAAFFGLRQTELKRKSVQSEFCQLQKRLKRDSFLVVSVMAD